MKESQIIYNIEHSKENSYAIHTELKQERCGAFLNEYDMFVL